ncbi:MAG: hypothetical protein CMJ81_09485 [Planctomycetaceae bacterium]|nr:hypothetical protein [Planctomycetaceae bacterium]MBP63032.1 hypothetical protein [Planctomycetaceae bacterium]
MGMVETPASAPRFQLQATKSLGSIRFDAGLSTTVITAGDVVREFPTTCPFRSGVIWHPGSCTRKNHPAAVRHAWTWRPLRSAGSQLVETAGAR